MTSGPEGGGARVAVFSHPNHELAVYGWLARRRPHVVFLTDGGHPERREDSRRGLRRLGLEERCVFFDRPEARFYEALLEADVDYFRGVAAELREVIEGAAPVEVYCGAVELYNPIHDLALPVGQAALASLAAEAPPLYAIPVVHQDGGDGVQRARSSPEGVRELRLTREETAEKVAARDEVYGYLRERYGELLGRLSVEHLAREEFHGPLPPGSLAPYLAKPGEVIRYEVRGERLRERGMVERVIYHGQHYLPLVGALLSGSSP